MSNVIVMLRHVILRIDHLDAPAKSRSPITLSFIDECENLVSIAVVIASKTQDIGNVIMAL